MEIMRILLILVQLRSIPARHGHIYDYPDPDTFKSLDNNKPPCTLNKYCTFLYVKYMIDECLACRQPALLDTTNCAPVNISSMPETFFIFQEQEVLHNNLINLINLVNLSYVPGPFNDIGQYYFKGIDLDFFTDLKDYESVNTYFQTISLEMVYGSFEIYHHGQHLNTLDTCNSENYRALMTKSGENVLQVFHSISFHEVNFNSRICKYLFQNISIDMLLLNKNVFEFMEDSDEHKNSLVSSNITSLYIERVRRLQLSTKLLDPDVFKNLRGLSIGMSSIYKIQVDLFNNRFHSIREILFNLKNFKDFLHGQAGATWFHYLNRNREPIDLIEGYSRTNQTLSLNSTKYAILAFNAYGVKIEYDLRSPKIFTNYSNVLYPLREYEFPDLDFCLFYDAPSEKMVFILVGNLRNVTCTVAWLYRYQHLYEDIGLYTLTKPIPTGCNFSRLTELCRITNKSELINDEYVYFMFDDLDQTLMKVKSVLQVYLQPISSGFGFISNMLVVWTIVYNHARRREIRTQPKTQNQEIVLLDQFLYKYVLFNSVLNSIYTLMYFIDCWIPCITRSDSCTIKDDILHTIGSVVKLMSNFSLLQISLNRYLLIGKDHSERLVKLSKIKIKKFFYITFLLSLALSSVIYFQVSLFEFNTVEYDFNPNGYMYQNIFDQILRIDHPKFYPEFFSRMSEIPIVSSFILIHDMFSYFLFCLFSLILDIITVKKLKDALQEKERVKGQSDSQKNRDSERRSIIMVVSSSLINFLFRAPELLSIVFFYIVISDGGYVFRIMCIAYSDCKAFIELSNVFYIMSLCFYLIFYVKFNSVFRCSFMMLTQSCFSKD